MASEGVLKEALLTLISTIENLQMNVLYLKHHLAFASAKRPILRREKRRVLMRCRRLKSLVLVQQSRIDALDGLVSSRLAFPLCTPKAQRTALTGCASLAGQIGRGNPSVQPGGSQGGVRRPQFGCAGIPTRCSRGRHRLCIRCHAQRTSLFGRTERPAKVGGEPDDATRQGGARGNPVSADDATRRSVARGDSDGADNAP